jgi:glycerol uptake facilitator protein
MNARRRWRWQQSTVGELAAEFLGTFVLMTLGTGVVAMEVAALNQSGRGPEPFVASGDWMLIALGWGLAVTFGVYVAGGVSGAHLNPAVTLAMAARRGFAWAKVPGYMLAQLLGAFVGAGIVYLNYRSAILAFEGANDIVRGTPDSVTTFSIFATFPAPYFDSWFGPFMDQVLGTALLVACIFAVTDEHNTPVQGNVAPFVVGLIVVAVGLSFGANAGYAINPARDLGPRIMTWIAGWKEVAMPGDYEKVSFYLWVPILGPLIGGLIGAFAYDGVIRNVLLARGQTADPEVEERGQTTKD